MKTKTKKQTAEWMQRFGAEIERLLRGWELPAMHAGDDPAGTNCSGEEDEYQCDFGNGPIHAYEAKGKIVIELVDDGPNADGDRRKTMSGNGSPDDCAAKVLRQFERWSETMPTPKRKVQSS